MTNSTPAPEKKNNTSSTNTPKENNTLPQSNKNMQSSKTVDKTSTGKSVSTLVDTQKASIANKPTASQSVIKENKNQSAEKYSSTISKNAAMNKNNTESIQSKNDQNAQPIPTDHAQSIKSTSPISPIHAESQPDTTSTNAAINMKSSSNDAEKKGTDSKISNNMRTISNNNQSTTVSQSDKPKENHTGTILSAISLATVLALAGYTYYQMTYKNDAQYSIINNQQKEIVSLSNQLNTLKNNYDALLSTKTALEQLQQQVKSDLAQQQHTIDSLILTDKEHAQQVTQLKTKVFAMSESESVGDTVWLLTESNFFVKQAVRKLNHDHDAATAIALLVSADANLAELNDPSLNNVRNAINRDLTTLRAIPHIDREGIIIRLQQLSQQVDTLSMSLPKNIFSTNDEMKPEELSNSVSDWRQNLTKSWKTFIAGFVTVRQRNPVNAQNKPELTPNQQAYLQENIRMQLLIAAQSVPIQQQEIYQTALANASSWAKTYYINQDPATQAFITELDQLSHQTIQTSLPTELSSQPLLEKVVQHRVRNLLTGSSLSNKSGE